MPADSVSVPLSAIIQAIPRELHGRLAPAGAAGHSYSISRGTVLEQLPRGSVKVAFGELRRSAPAGLFTNSHSHDSTLVDLPLGQILKQLRPEDYAPASRRPVLEPPPDVDDIFGKKGECLAALRVLRRDEALKPVPSGPSKPTIPTLPNAAPPPPAESAAAIPMWPVPQAQMPTPPAGIPGPAPLPTPAAPIPSPTAKTPGLPKPGVSSPAGRGTPLPAAPAPLPKPAPTPPPAEVSVVPVSPANPSIPAMGQPEASPAHPEAFLVAMDILARGWPEEIRQEIARFKIPHVKCAFAPGEMCEGLKTGKIEYTWEQLRAKISPTPLYLEPSDYADTVLELPLNVVTPLFLDFIRSMSQGDKPINPEHTTEFFRKAEAAAPKSDKAAKPSSGSRSTTTFRKKPLAGQTSRATAVPAGPLTVSLSLISSSWPPAVLKEIQQHNLAESMLEIPPDAIAPGLKRGKIEFSWSQLAGWLRPCPPEVHKSPLGETSLPLPLSVVAPLYLAQRPAQKAGRLSAELESIPDIFSSTKPKEEAPSLPDRAAPVAAPAPVPAAAPAPPSKSEVPEAPSRPPQNIAELFGEPQKKNWTPNEIVNKCAGLPGVKGALMVLQDGLLVASCMPPGRKTETIAAFLPQIMGRMSQYAKEFGMGELQSVSVTVEQGTLRIYNAGIIYFAALGSPDGDLPLDSLQLIAVELGRHTK